MLTSENPPKKKVKHSLRLLIWKTHKKNKENDKPRQGRSRTVRTKAVVNFINRMVKVGKVKSIRKTATKLKKPHADYSALSVW